MPVTRPIFEAIWPAMWPAVIMIGLLSLAKNLPPSGLTGVVLRALFAGGPDRVWGVFTRRAVNGGLPRSDV